MSSSLDYWINCLCVYVRSAAHPQCILHFYAYISHNVNLLQFSKRQSCIAFFCSALRSSRSYNNYQPTTTTEIHSNAFIFSSILPFVCYCVFNRADFSHHDLLIVVIAVVITFDMISRNLFIIGVFFHRLFLLLSSHINNINTINSFNLYLVVSTSTAKWAFIWS